MKKRLILSFVLIIMIPLIFCACTKTGTSADLWDNAIYKSDTAFGKGAKTITLTVNVKENSVEFTINTDEDILGDALIAHKLIEGEKGSYGLYVKKVNGITADYDIDHSYWSLSKNGGYMNTGVDSTKIKDGETYEFTYIKD